MDETELLIIKRMTEDARTPFRKIAKELGVSPDTIISRYKTLIEKVPNLSKIKKINNEKMEQCVSNLVESYNNYT